jgi:hypothetical protein
MTYIEMELPRKEGAYGDQDGAGSFKKSGRVLCEGVAARYSLMQEVKVVSIT